MITEAETTEILRVLNGLPKDKIKVVQDFVNFLHLQNQRSQVIDDGDEWSDEDLLDFTSCSRFVEMSIK